MMLRGKFDGHLHTNNSDGDESPEEVLKKAHRSGYTVVSITDHNTFSFSEPFLFKESLLVVPGCEFSCFYEVPAWGDRSEIHVIGYFPGGVDPTKFADIFERVLEGRELYISSILDSLYERGMRITMEEVKAESRPGKRQLGRPEIARALVRRGFASTIDQAFDLHIGNSSPYYVPNRFVDYAPMPEVIKRIRAEHGIPVLCHPYFYNLYENEIDQLAADFKSCCGELGGMEVYYEAYLENPGRISFLENLARKYGLYPTASSDRHRAEQGFASAGDIQLYRDLIAAFQAA